MIKHLMLLAALLTSLQSFAQVQNLTPGQYTPGFFSTVNFVKNPSCYANTQNLTVTGGSVSRTTSSPISSVASCSVTLGTSAQTFKWTSRTFDNRLNGQNCEARFTYAGDGTKLKAYVEQGVSNTKVSPELQLIDSGSNSQDVTLNFPCGSNSNATRLVLEATASGAGALKVSDAYLGIATNLSGYQTVTKWQAYTPTFANFGTVSSVEFKWRRVGKNVEIQGRWTSGTTAAATGTISMPPGLVADLAGALTTTFGQAYCNAGSAQAFTVLAVDGSNNMTFANQTSGPLTATNASAFLGSTPASLNASIPILGWDSENAIRVTQIALQPAGEIMPFAGATCPAGWLLADGSAVSRSTYSQLYSRIGNASGSGDGSTTFNLPDYRWAFLRGLGPNTSASGSGSAASNNATFTAHGFTRTGIKVRMASGTLSGLATSTDYWLIVVDSNTLAFASSRANALAGTKIAISGANSAVITQYEDPDVASRLAQTVGGNTGANVGSYQADDYKSHTHTQVGTANLAASAGASTYAMATGAAAAGTTQASGGTETRPTNVGVTYCLRAYDQSAPAPILVGSITSGATGAERVERVRVASQCTASPCTITSQSGSWVSTITRGSTGVYTVNVNSGTFSSTPTCTCSGEAAGVYTWCQIAPASATSLAVYTSNGGSNTVDSSMAIICMGPR